MIAHDVEDGRRKLNFSIWGDYTDTKRSSLASQIIEEVVDGEMPPSQYMYLHGNAKVSAADFLALQSWADTIE